MKLGCFSAKIIIDRCLLVQTILNRFYLLFPVQVGKHWTVRMQERPQHPPQPRELGQGQVRRVTNTHMNANIFFTHCKYFCTHCKYFWCRSTALILPGQVRATLLLLARHEDSGVVVAQQQDRPGRGRAGVQSCTSEPQVTRIYTN